MSEEDLNEVPQEIDTDESAQAVPVEADESDVQEPEAAAPAPAQEWNAEDEEEARLFGWKPKAEWVGDLPPGYIEKPEEYLDRVKRSRIFKTMQDKLTEQERKLGTMSERALERQKAQYEAQLQDISAKQRRAVEEADTETWDALERQKADLQKNAPQPEAPQQQADPYLTEYRQTEQGAWTNNPVLMKTGVDLINANPVVNGVPIMAQDAKAQVAYAEQELRKMYPAYFPSAAKPKPRQNVDAGGLASGAPSAGRSAFEKLPSDAKQAFKRFVERGVYEDSKKDREDYANEYNAA